MVSVVSTMEGSGHELELGIWQDVDYRRVCIRCIIVQLWERNVRLFIRIFDVPNRKLGVNVDFLPISTWKRRFVIN